uniref:Transcription initiation factor TFIID subunit 2 n=2 Tax=Anthurium amnicola TaxID=1678845 RepID=A0A1D1ZHW3_9ARAE
MAKPRKQKAGEQPSKPPESSGATGTVLHQKLCLSIDMKRRLIYGHTEMKILFPESGFIGLHAVNMTIGCVSVNGEPIEFEFFPHCQVVEDEKRWCSVSCSTTAADAACLTYISSLYKEMVPNLFISCRKTVNSLNVHDYLANGGDRSQNTAEPKIIPNGHLDSDFHQSVKLVRINFQVDVAESGIHFGSNLLYTDSQIRRARCWFPCMDSSLQCCCYDLEFTVDSNLVAVSNGDLLYQVLNQDDPSRKTYVYKLNIPVSACWISLSVAPFEILADSRNGLLSHMSLTPDFSKLRNTVGFFHSAFGYYEDYLSTSFPFRSYKQVFIPQESSVSPVSLGASMCTFGSNLLFDEKIIDETIQTRFKLAYALARQWFGVYIFAETPNDEWLVDGLAGFLTDSFIKRFLGNNEAHFQRYKANYAVCEADVSGATALSSSAAAKDLYGTERLGLFGKVRSWKAVAILQMLEKQMGPESFRKILQRVIHMAQDASRSLRTLSTKEFRHLANKVGNLERPFLKEFFPRWVGSCGCPVLWMGFSYNKRRNVIELAVVRDSTAPTGAISADSPSSESREGAAGGPGMMSIRVHELDGMYDHPSLPMTGETWQLLEIQCHSKLATKRIQKPKKGSKPDGSDENTDAGPTLDARTCLDSPLSWLRADPEMEYLAKIHFHQPLQMWINQLEKDKDVVAQCQAIAILEALPQHPFSVVNALNGVLNDSKAFWRVRIEAALALAHTASEDTDWAGLLHLVKFYKSRQFDAEIGLPRPNDFHDVPEYFVLKVIPRAVALVRAADKTSPREAVEFILQLLKYNDNSGNPYSDVYWLASLVQSISELEFGQQNIMFLSSLLKRIDRLLQFDSLMPSHNGLLTISCIRTLAQIALKMSASVSLDRVFNLLNTFRNDKKTQWRVQIEASRALLTLEFYWKGLDAALSLFLEFLEQEPSLRGQVKLTLHTMHLCEVNLESENQNAITCPTLLALLQLLASRKAYNNIYLRHHLFCILQIIAGRPPTLYGVDRVQPQNMVEHLVDAETGGGQEMMASFLKLRVSKPQEPLVDIKKPEEPIADIEKTQEPLVNALKPREPLGDAQKTQGPLVDAQKIKVLVETRASSSGALPVSQAAKDVDTVSVGHERKYPVVKIKVKQRASSATDYLMGISHGGNNETDVGPTSSVSVDAPGRSLANEPTSTSDQNREVNSFHDHGSRMTASVGSAKLASFDDGARELQCTADSRTSRVPEDRLSPAINLDIAEPHVLKGSPEALYVERVEEKPSLSIELQKSIKHEKKEKKSKKDERKRKREDKVDQKGHHDDPEYLERKRLKKEKKRMEKESKIQTMEPKPSPDLQTWNKTMELGGSSTAVKKVGVVEAKPSKSEALQTSSGTKLRIKLKRPNGGNSQPVVK